MLVGTEDLRKAASLILNHLDETGQSTVEIKDDYYWAIPPEELYNPYSAPAPTNFTLGQLSDDWNEIISIIDGQREPVGYSLVWLAAILKRVGELAVG